MDFLKAKYRKRLLAWIAALESGDYKKGKSYLRTTDGKYCCLGVACEVAKVRPRKISPRGFSWPNLAYLGENTYLPEKVRKYFGLMDPFGQFKIEKSGTDTIFESLSVINDSTRTFKAVLKILKNPPKSLFTTEAILKGKLNDDA